MKVLGLVKLHKFCKSHADCVAQILAWTAEAKEAEWITPNDIRARYANASFLQDNSVVFNIKGNTYRLDTKVYYERQVVIVKRIGTHAEYDKWKF
ncbi:MAG: addiction module toxin RelE [Chloroflexi bacterium RBG_13_50_10]|nr:MAG: addiction module toxin RelE [Chloroflexi bacterium RBG_13_50_10]